MYNSNTNYSQLNKNIIFFGKNKSHPRELFFLEQLKKFNYTVIYINNNKNLILRILFLIKFFFYKFDLTFISWPGWSDIFFIKILAILKKKKIIYDSLTINYEDYLDNYSESINLLKKKIYYILEKKSLNLADIVITDTNQHKRILKEEFKIKDVKLIYINEKKKFIKKKIYKLDRIDLIFTGAFRNLHGIENIIKSFKIINLYNRKIYLTLIGSDYDSKYKNIAKKLMVKNIYFFPRLKYKQMICKVEQSDICLGIFGESQKSQNVITHFLATASRLNKIIVTQNTSAAKEVFKNNENCHLINKPLVANLARKILLIAKNIESIKKKNSARFTFDTFFNSNKQSEKFKNIMLNI
jgi:glycosyltransferase involved in cell wall biosynthesis